MDPWASTNLRHSVPWVSWLMGSAQHCQRTPLPFLQMSRGAQSQLGPLSALTHRPVWKGSWESFICFNLVVCSVIPKFPPRWWATSAYSSLPFLEVKFIENVIVNSAFGWIFTLAVWMANGIGFSLSGEAWLLYQEREDAVDDSIIQMLDDVVLLMLYFVIGLFHWTTSGFSGIFKLKFWNFCSKL